MEAFDYYNWIILPLIIFVSRLCDVSLGTLRHVFVSKGYKNIVPVLGFFEVLIWIVIVKQIMNNVDNPVCYLAWAAGFATGTYIGLKIEEALALGLQVVRIITNQECSELIDALRRENHGITVLDAEGAKGPVKMIFTIVKRKNVENVVKLIREHNPSAFYSVEDIKDTSKGIFTQRTGSMSFIRGLFPLRKGK